jgi:hypothetical protein
VEVKWWVERKNESTLPKLFPILMDLLRSRSFERGSMENRPITSHQDVPNPDLLFDPVTIQIGLVQLFLGRWASEWETLQESYLDRRHMMKT